jgi:hypothetical protein
VVKVRIFFSCRKGHSLDTPTVIYKYRNRYIATLLTHIVSPSRVRFRCYNTLTW